MFIADEQIKDLYIVQRILKFSEISSDRPLLRFVEKQSQNSIEATLGDEGRVRLDEQSKKMQDLQPTATAHVFEIQKQFQKQFQVEFYFPSILASNLSAAHALGSFINHRTRGSCQHP